ncbi:hypothetical protein ARMSODRAFT_967424 [Armillaria solidipes]|uniref:Uncharacterized protein n=1 Tax=Armillaria solidipes TaxID=1076256 RepID=A0A2H3AIU5_9AGAR|nr:hypothetical protein ARMSODRAFT_967424 [Armillaria solidipes]
MIILEEDECTPLKGDSTTPVSPTSPSQLSSPDSPPSYNEAVVCNPFSRHPSYDAIPIPESLNLESLDRVSDKRRRRRNRHRVHMMLLFLALTGCIVFWLTFAIFFEPGGLARKGGRNPPPGPPPDGRKHRGPPPEEEEENSRGPPDGEDRRRGDGPPPEVVDEGPHGDGPPPPPDDAYRGPRGERCTFIQRLLRPYLCEASRGP